MGFLQDQTVIHIKLTDKGRELLSRGLLRFNKFAIGDSEIDYEHIENSGLDIVNSAILRPFDRNPEIVSFIPQNAGGDVFTQLPSISNTTSTITNSIDPKGMFFTDPRIDALTGLPSKLLYSDAAHVKQPSIQIVTSQVQGGRELTLNKSTTYVNGSPEPVVGDYIMVKWANRGSTRSTTGYDVNNAQPYLFYKITSIISGSLANNSLRVMVDRDLPNFGGVSTPFNSGAVIYPNNNGRKISGDSIQNYYGAPFVTDFVSESMISFLENYDTPTIDVPVWNMTIVFTEDVAGIDPAILRGFGKNPSVEFGGVVKYLQKIDPTVTNIGLIHYTNNSPSNNYGEGFAASNTTTPKLDLPTIMWHKNTGGTMGLTLTGDYASIDTLPELDTTYMNLVDEFGNVVGKVFTDLKLFIIEDQDLLFAMSYKSNRNWTLPPVVADFNASLCPTSDVEVSIEDVIVATTTIPPTTPQTTAQTTSALD